MGFVELTEQTTWIQKERVIHYCCHCLSCNYLALAFIQSNSRLRSGLGFGAELE